MQLSELIATLQTVEAKFGDMPVGAYSAEYCYELGKADHLMGIQLRVMTSYADANASTLPGINPTADSEEDAPSKFLTIFYLDD